MSSEYLYIISVSSTLLNSSSKQVIAVKKEHLDEYKAVSRTLTFYFVYERKICQIHANVWDTVLNGLRRSHIVDYSIHFMPAPPFPMAHYSKGTDVGGLLIATFKYIGQDFEGDMKRAAEDDETRKWWKITDPMQHSFVEGAKSSEEGPWWYECEEVFRFEK